MQASDIATKNDLEAMEARLGGRLHAVDERLDAVEGRLDAVEGRLDAVDGWLDAVDGRLGSVERQLAAMDGRLEGMEGRLSDLGTHLTRHIETCVEASEYRMRTFMLERLEAVQLQTGARIDDWARVYTRETRLMAMGMFGSFVGLGGLLLAAVRFV